MRVLIICFSFNKQRMYGDPSVWYRCSNFAERMHDRGITCDLISEDEMDRVIDYLSFYSKVIFFRPRHSQTLVDVLTGCWKLGVDTVASYDDLIFDPSTYTISSTLKSGARKDLIHSRYKDWANAFDLFDRFIVSTDFLKKQVLLLNAQADVYIIDNVLSSDMEHNISVWSKDKDKDRTIGYFGGGISHKDDILMIRDDLISVCDKYKAKIFIPQTINEVVKIPEHMVHSFERLNYIEMLKICSKVNVCVAPLILDDNSKAKSAIKLTEAVTCRSPLVATYIDAYESYKSTNVFFEADGNWVQKISEAFESTLYTADYLECLNILESRFVDNCNLFLES